MRILITGATGFIGQAVVRRLKQDGHELAAWVRDVAMARQQLGADVDLVDSSGGSKALDGAVDRSDGFVNLAGAPLLPGRWTARRKQELMDSRIRTTERLVDALSRAEARSRVLVSASAVGYYGDTGDRDTDEAAAVGPGFLAELCQAWESAAMKADTDRTRVVIGRIGIVLGTGGGMLAQLLPLFKLGLGGPLGSGRQFLPWIHIEDLVEIFATALVDDRYRGPFNAVGPAPVRMGELTRTLGRVLHRPAFFRAPSFVLKIMLGEASTALLMSSHVRPRRLQELGFTHRFGDLDAALRDLLDVAK